MSPQYFKEPNQFQVSNVVYPLPTGTNNSALYDLDSCIYWLLEFNAGVLQANAGARWTQEVNSLQAVGLASNIPNTFVGMRLPYNPIPFLKESTFTYPLLAIYRADNGAFREKSITGFFEAEQDLELVFIFPPMKAEEMEHLFPFTNAVKDIVGNKNEHGYDPNWNGGEWIGPLANYEWIAAKTFSITTIPTETDLVMPTVIIGLRLKERNIAINANLDQTPADALTNLNLQSPDGYAGGTYYPDGYVQDNFIVVDGYYNPKPYGT